MNSLTVSIIIIFILIYTYLIYKLDSLCPVTKEHERFNNEIDKLINEGKIGPCIQSMIIVLIAFAAMIKYGQSTGAIASLPYIMQPQDMFIVLVSQLITFPLIYWLVMKKGILDNAKLVYLVIGLSFMLTLYIPIIELIFLEISVIDMITSVFSFILLSFMLSYILYDGGEKIYLSYNDRKYTFKKGYTNVSE